MPIEFAAESVDSRAQLAAVAAVTGCESSGPVGVADVDGVTVVTIVEYEVDAGAAEPPAPHAVRTMAVPAAAMTTKIFCTLRR